MQLVSKLVLTTVSIWFGSAFANEPHDIINGEIVRKEDWSAHVQISTLGGVCSGTVVGPRTVIMAAHCVSGVKAQVVSVVGTFMANCTKHPMYPEQDLDIAICKTETDMTGIVAENIELTAPVPDEEVTLFGYGCTIVGGGGGNDGNLRMGQAVAVDIANSELQVRGAAACWGDSGGSAMVGLSQGNPKAIGVMSKGNIKDSSWIALFDRPENAKFIADWAKANPEAAICGFSSNVSQCRNGSTQTLPQSCLTLKALNFKHFAQFKTCLFETVLPPLDECAELKGLIDSCFDERR